MDDLEEDPDLLNEETFDCAEIGDWENEHDQFVQNFHKVSEESPAADELPKFWNDTGGLSFLWQTDDLGCGVTVDDGGEKVVDVEETLQKLVLDETFEDPAILDISRKVSYQQLNEDSFQHLRNAPAYPTAPTDIFDRTRDIWSIDGSHEIGYGSGKTSTASDCNMKSKNVIDILRSLNVYPPPSVKTVSIPPEASTENYLSRKVATESQTREVGTELFSKASQSSRNLQNIVPVSQHKLYPSPVFSSGQSQAVQNSLSVHNGIHANHLRANPFSLDILRGQFPTDANVFSTLPAMQSVFKNLHPPKLDYSQIHEYHRTYLKAASIFYPHLREIIYQLKHINDFLKLCFPEALKMNYDSQLTIPITDNLKSLLSCKLGLSLIFCLLDACARASNPTDPSDFIRFGAYFSYANSFIDRTCINNTTNECDYVMESFPHLASILLLYIKPSKYATKTIKTPNNDITKYTTITTANNNNDNNNMDVNQQLSTGIIDSATANYASVSSLSSSSLTQCCATVSDSHNSAVNSHHHATQQHLTMDNSVQTPNSQNSENVLSNITKNPDDLSASVVVEFSMQEKEENAKIRFIFKEFSPLFMLNFV
ncbi:unnamed protein product [Schistosoma margrebowiei]|uniref:Uncharacterized protein n=1 Tax=Schistosoma margrebowiei TaxID=48269 RepID=A0AA84ZQX0_9TREM|nr:unnamed protein product [Schistosoma margrebowiei]